MAITSCPWPQSGQLADFCEAEICGWIVEPANTWSNLSFLIVGGYILFLSRRSGSRYLSWIGWTSLTTGVGSGLFHATGQPWTGKLDIFSMFLGTGMMTALNLRRWLGTRYLLNISVFLLVTLGLILASLSNLFNDRLLYGLFSPCLWIEARLFFRDRKQIRYRYFLLSWVLVSAAFTFWWLDTSHTWCDPQNHFISGHALWHLLTSLSFLSFYRYYCQFDLLRSPDVR